MSFSDFAVVADQDGLVHVISLRTGQTVMRWIVTLEGWAVVDDQGRFEGDIEGLDKIAWAVEKRHLDISGFSEKYYEPGLLSRVFAKADKGFLNESSRRIEDGIFMPPEVTVTLKKQQGRSADISITAKAHTSEDLEDIQNVYLYLNGKRVPGKLEVSRKKIVIIFLLNGYIR